MKRFNCWYVFTVFTGFVYMMGCQTAEKTSVMTPTPAGVLEEADRLFQKERYEAALAKYTNYVYSPFPNKQKLPTARYNMGVCHYFLGQYSEAVDSLTIVLNTYPAFPYESEAVELIRKSQEKIQERQSARQAEEIEQLNTIVTLNQQLEKAPEDARLHYQLGNQYWEAGDVQTAALHYEQAILQNPEYAKNNLIRNRVYYNDQNVLVPRNPVADLQAQDDTIRLSNVRHEVRKRTDFLGRVESIRVSGEAKNVSLRRVDGVQIEITLVDFFETIQDSRTVSLGSIRPGQTRTFSLVLDQFSGSAHDNLKVRTHVTYDG